MFCGKVCGKMFLFLGVGKEITRYPSNIHYGRINLDFTWWGQGVISHTFAKFEPLLCVWILLIRRSGCWFYVIIGVELKGYRWWDAKPSCLLQWDAAKDTIDSYRCAGRPLQSEHCTATWRKRVFVRGAKSLHRKLEQATHLKLSFLPFFPEVIHVIFFV